MVMQRFVQEDEWKTRKTAGNSNISGLRAVHAWQKLLEFPVFCTVLEKKMQNPEGFQHFPCPDAQRPSPAAKPPWLEIGKIEMLEFPMFFALFGGLCGSTGIVGIYTDFMPSLNGYAATCARRRMENAKTLGNSNISGLRAVHTWQKLLEFSVFLNSS